MMERPSEPTHRQFEDMAVSHVLGGLSADDGRLFRSHLLDCPSCRARVGELRAIAHDLADVERDERRAAGRRQVETKPVDTGVETDEEPDGTPSRRWFFAAVTGLVALLGLLTWNFVLRGNNQHLVARNNAMEQAAVVLEFGTPWTIAYPPEGDPSLRAAAAEMSGDLTLLLDGAESDPHQLYFLAEDGRRVGQATTILPADRRWLYLAENVPDRAVRLQLTRADVATDGPTGPTILEAARP
jgi:Putative zinc-finger